MSLNRRWAAVFGFEEEFKKKESSFNDLDQNITNKGQKPNRRLKKIDGKFSYFCKESGADINVIKSIDLSTEVDI